MNSYSYIPKKHHHTGFIIFAVILLFFAAGLTTWFVGKRILPNPQAKASTSLSYDNSVQTVGIGQDIVSNIIVDPGSNKVSLIKFAINYDGSKFATTSGLVVNTTAFPQTLDGPTYTCSNSNCSISMTISIGSDPTKAIQTQTTAASLHLKAIASTQGPVQILFDKSTSIFSIGSADQASENVLSSASPLTVTVNGSNGNPTPTTGGSCQMNVSNCQWDSRSTATSYHYKIEDVTSGNVIKEGDIDASQTQVDFPSQPGRTYTCTITATNACKTSNPKSTTITCPILSITPTPSICSGPGMVKNLHISCPSCTGNQ